VCPTFEMAKGIPRALACAGFALVGLALIVLGLLGRDTGAGLLGSDGASALGRLSQSEAAWHAVWDREPPSRLEKAATKLDGEFDWCVSKAKRGSCGAGPVARWCAQVCQANDMDGECLQSLLDIKCSRLLPDSAARFADGKWSCYTGLFKSEADACIDDAGGMVSCYQPDPTLYSVDAHSALTELITDNGCNADEPTDWVVSHPHPHIGGCDDMLPWTSKPDAKRNQKGPVYECADYARHGWCSMNNVVDKSHGGRKNNYPEEHCCVCGGGSAEDTSHIPYNFCYAYGGGSTESPDVPDEIACSESKLAVHVALATYYNGSTIQKYLPQHFRVIQEFHTKLSADAFIAVDESSKICWAAFRGSQELDDWLTDALSALATQCFASNGHTIGECSYGFYEQYDSLRQAGIVRTLANLANKGNCVNGIRVVGHSLGGGLASIASADFFTLSEDTNSTREIRFPYMLTPETFRVYSFGEPRSLRWYSADWFHSNVAKVRWLNWGDPIPASPPSSWGFKHWGKAYEITSDLSRKHTWKHMSQDHGASGFYVQNHQMEPYISRLAASCAPRE